jgi:hypothetical protein
MKKIMIALAISGVALMAQTGAAPATSNGTKDSTAAPTTKVKKHGHHKKAAATGAPAASSTDAASKPVTK